MSRATLLISFLVNWLFFVEYLPPFHQVFIPYDMEGYHWPLMDYVFRELRTGRFPEWDPAQYCGIPLAGNIQAALFYPPGWLLYLAALGKQHLPYMHLQVFVLLHYWLAFVLCYAWLHARRLHPLALWLGAGIFAYGGYLLTQMQHFGLVAGVAWWPLAFWGVDEASARGSSRPLWKVVAASAMVLLAGYPPLWIVFAICVSAYAAPVMPIPRIGAALGVSLLVSAVQLMPALEANRIVPPDIRYGPGNWDLAMYTAFLAPNAYEFGLHTPRDLNFGRDYWYPGGAGLLGLLFALRRWPRGAAGALAMAGAALTCLLNPFSLVSWLIDWSPHLLSLFRNWYFLAGLSSAVALLAALGLDAYLRSERDPGPPRRTWLAVGAAALWAVRLLWVWYPWDMRDFAIGWQSGLDALVSVLLAGWLAARFVRAKGSQRSIAAIGFVLFAFVELKAFGTSRRFNGSMSRPPAEFTAEANGFDRTVWARMASDHGFRVAVSAESGPYPTAMRPLSLPTPQGFDPLISGALRKTVEANGGAFVTDRLFALDPTCLRGLRDLGVKYFAAPETSKEYAKLSSDRAWRFLGGSLSFFKVFEMTDARPAWSWSGSSIELMEWLPGKRVFTVRGSGTLRLVEHDFPGWRASVDRQPTVIQRCGGVFQCVEVPEGAQTVTFEYRPLSLRGGALISAGALIAIFAAKKFHHPVVETAPTRVFR